MRAAAIAFLVFILASPSVMAGGRPSPPPPPGPEANAQAIAAQAQGQIQGQLQGQHQSVHIQNSLFGEGSPASLVAEGAVQLTTGDTVMESGDTTVTVDSSVPLQRYNNPNIWLNIPNPTAPCMGSAGIGGAGGGMGLSIGGTKEDRECTARETARMFANLGQYEFALKILCSTKGVERTGLATECPTNWQPPKPEKVVVKSQCDEKLKRCETVQRK